MLFFVEYYEFKIEKLKEIFSWGFWVILNFTKITVIAIKI